MLRSFLSLHRDAILARMRSHGPRGPASATEQERVSGFALLLEQLIDILPPSPVSSAAIVAIEKTATTHGGHLLQRGFTVAQVVHEYGSLGRAILELLNEANLPVPPEQLHTLTLCLDEATAWAVTEYARQREQFMADEEKERFGELAHELRGSIGSAMISFEMLRSGTAGFAGSTAGVLGRSLSRLSSLVDASVASARLESGIRALQRVSVRQFIEEVEVGAAMEASARKLTLGVVPGEQGVEVEVDRPLLAAAVGNLLNNAFKFTRLHGHVVLRTMSASDRVVIEVEDECGGLPAGKAETLFRPFEQRGADRTGLGLGLSISRKGVEANGGQMRVRDMPGVGCVFIIDLPRIAHAT